MADYGITKRFTRDKLPLQVLTGFFPTEPVKLSSLAPCIDGEAIKSGMAIVKGTGTIGGISAQVGWKKAAAADAISSKSVYIALQDQDDMSVQASGKLVGLDCSDKFEVQTGYYYTTTDWAVDDAITVGIDGSSNKGFFVKAVNTTDGGAGDYIVGRITAIGGDTNKAISYLPSATGTANVNGLVPSTTAANSLVIQFKTAACSVRKTAAN
jgi:hypothetical protein